MENENKDSYSAESYKKLINTVLKEINQKVEAKMTFEEREDVFGLVMEYGEFNGQMKFIEGFIMISVLFFTIARN